MPDAAGARDGATTAAAPPSAETVYHVRLIQSWPSETPPASQERVRFSFFGLELELLGFHAGSGDLPVPATCPLQFAKPAVRLASTFGPFKIRVVDKMVPANSDAASESEKLVLQSFSAVQPGNFLLEINSVRFLQTSSTGRDVHRCLLRTLTQVSLAKPFEFTFQRHNHPQAAAKIVPFAMRADVQVVQVAQYKKMQEQETQLSEAVRRKKQFLTQQMDYELEHYLFDHIGVELFDLYEEIMANGQWQAYEFEQALWYYHTPTSRLYAEHPMRNSEKTRQLIRTAQFRTRFAVQKLQRATRVLLRRKQLADAAIDLHLYDRIWAAVWHQTWTKIWIDQLLPLYTPAPLSTVEQDVEQLWDRWRNRNLQPIQISDEVPATPAVGNVPQLTDVVKNGIPSVAPMREPATPITVVVEEKQQRGDACVPNSPTTLDIQEQTTLDTHEPISDPVTPEEVLMPSASQRCDDEQKRELADEEPSPDSKSSGVYDDDDSAQWRGYLTLLKSNLGQKKGPPPKRHRVQEHFNQSLRNQSDAEAATNVGLAYQQTRACKESEDEHKLSFRPRATHNSSADVHATHLSISPSTRLGSSIAPPRSHDVAPFMLGTQHSAYDPDFEASLLLSSVLPAHIDPQKAGDRGLPAPTLLKPASDSFEDVDSWHRSGSFRAFHSFFARNLDDPEDIRDSRIRDHPAQHLDTNWEKASVGINQHKQEPSQSLPHSRASQSPSQSLSHRMANAPSATSNPQPKPFTATEMEILLRQDRSKASAPSAKSPTKLPYIVRRKTNGQR